MKNGMKRSVFANGTQSIASKRLRKVFSVFMSVALALSLSPFGQAAYADGDEPAGSASILIAPSSSANNAGDDVSSAVADSNASGEGAANSNDENVSENPSAQDADGASVENANAAESDGASFASYVADAQDESGTAMSLASEDNGDNPVPGKKYGNITFSQNTETNGFLNSEYDAYRDGGTALGIANSFHIVAFDTLSAPVDVYGNVLVKNLSTISDMGTSQKFVDIYGHNTLSYIQNYSGAFPRWDKSQNGCVVFGSNVDLSTRNNSELLVNGTRIDSPNTVVRDADTSTNPFIDLDALCSTLRGTSAKLAAQPNVGATQQTVNDGKVRNITIEDGYTGCAYITLSAADLTSSYEGINIDNLSIKGSSALVINVDCQGASSVDIPRTYLRINGQNVGIGEVDSVYGDTGYVLYNFYNTADNLPISVHECTASVLAPNASLTLGPGSACGTFIANNVSVAAESHTRPFHGNLTPGEDVDDTTAVSVSKVWLDADGNAEQGVVHDAVVAQLWYADAEGNATSQVLGSDGAPLVATLSAENGWQASWGELATKADGEDLHYTVREAEVPSGYEVAYESSVASDGSIAFVMKNTQKSEAEAFSLSGYSMRAADAPATDADKVCYVDPKVVKVLNGRTLTAGEFSFQLIDSAGNVVSEATNDETGMVDFDAANPVTPQGTEPCCLSFNATGTYVYTVRETPNQVKDSTISYSEEVVKFVVTIAADENGALYEKESYYLKYANAADAAAGVGAVRYASSEHPSITNTVKTVTLGLVKTDAATDKGLAGATYGLYRVDASAPEGSVLVTSATSVENGFMSFASTDASAIAAGETYFFREISAPAGYAISESQTQNFTIRATDNGTYRLVYEDGSLSPEYAGSATEPVVFKAGEGVTDAALAVAVGKVASDGSALGGATLAVRDASGADVEVWESSAAGHVVSGLVAGGTYVLYEKSAPSGYKLASEVTFKVDEYGNVSILEGEQSEGAVNAYASGASLSLVDYKQDEVVQKKELSREEGVPSNGAKTATMPKTGDNAPWIPIAVMAAGAGGAVAMARRKISKRS